MSRMTRVPSRVSPEADVVELAVDAQGDAAVVDAVVAEAELGVDVVVTGTGFGPAVVDGGRGGAVGQ